MTIRQFFAFLFMAIAAPISMAQNVATNDANHPGTLVQASLVTNIDAATAKPGARIEADIVTNVVLADGFSVPTGSRLEGHIVSLKKPSKSDAESAVVLKFNHLKTSSGARDVHATLVAVALITPVNKNPNSAQTSANDISTRAGMLNNGSASPMRSPQTAVEDSRVMPDSTTPVSPPVAAVGAHVGSVIGLPGTKISITLDGSELSAPSDVKLTRGLQLMLKIAN